MTDPFDLWEQELDEDEEDRIHRMLHDFSRYKRPGNEGGSQMEWIVPLEED